MRNSKINQLQFINPPFLRPFGFSSTCHSTPHKSNEFANNHNHTYAYKSLNTMTCSKSKQRERTKNEATETKSNYPNKEA